jgi:Tfp pilus assembly protein PilE
MTVIFIIALLASIAIPVYRRNIDKSLFNVCQSNLRNIVTAIENYHLENHAYPDKLITLTNKNFISNIPTCPSAHENTYEPGYEYDDESGEFTIECKGSGHRSLGYKDDEPFYVFSKGMGP